MTELSPETPVAEPPVFVDPGIRSQAVPLKYPLQYDGKVYDQVVVHRMTVGDIKSFSDRAAASPDAAMRLPMFDAPDAVMDALDCDDSAEVARVAGNFLPLSYRGDTAG